MRQDIGALDPLIEATIRELQRDFLSPDAVAASFDIMGLDTQLIDDGTSFIVESDGAIAGCAGWSRRAVLFSHEKQTCDSRDVANLSELTSLQ